MAGWIAVLVDNREYVRFCPLREGESGLINLTTMLPDQDRAYIEVYFVNGDLREQIHTFHASGIRTGDRRPQIVVSGHVRGDATVTLRVDGELVATESFPVPAAMRRARPGPWIAAAAALVLLAALGWGVWWLGWGADAPRAGGVDLASGGTAPGAGAAGTPADAGSADGGSAQGEPDDAPRADGGTGTAPEPPAADAPRGEPAVSTGAAESTGSTDEPDPPALPPTLSDPTILYFTPESARLILETRQKLDAVAAAIARWEAEGGDPEEIAVAAVGHTALFDTEASRLELSRERARAAAGYLAERMNELDVSAVGLETSGRGGREPVTRDENAQWRNRRVEIRVEFGSGE